MVVFNSTLNEFTRKYLVINPGEDQESLAATMVDRYQDALASVVEQLLFFDKISIKVYGENIPLAVLINELGPKQVLELIEDETLEFILWTPVLTTLQKDDPTLIGKMSPLQSGNLNSPVHCDPAESIREGLKGLRKQPKRSLRRDLERRARQVYTIPKPQFVHDAATLVTSAYETNKLADAGMPKTKDAAFLERDDRFRLLRLADEVLETAILADFKYTSIGKYRYYDLSRQTIDAIKAASHVLDSAQIIQGLEHLPNVRELLAAGQIDLKSLVRLRQKSVSRKFREWLATNSSDDSAQISKQYIEEIATHKGLLETRVGKLIKTLGVYGISMGVGAAIDGLTGGLIAAGTTKLVEHGAELGLSFIDNYFLDGILKGWQPKLFIDEYERLIKHP
jgi:hypothetical protein